MSPAPGDTPPRPRVPALIATHADLAQALVRAAESVVGPVEDVTIVSNLGLSKDELEEAIEEQVKGWSYGGLVFVDFWGSSCHTCGATAARKHGEVIIFTGVNLPLFLDYLYNREKFDVVALAERLQQKGRDSIRVQRGVPA